MQGISHIIKRPATLANFRGRKSPAPGIDRNLFMQIIMSIMTGSIRALDKRHRAGEVPSDQCDLCHGARQTSAHLFWDCPHFFETRRPFLASLRVIRDLVCTVQPEARFMYDYLVSTAAWRCCGIAGGIGSAISDYCCGDRVVSSFHEGVLADQLIFHFTFAIHLPLLW